MNITIPDILSSEINSTKCSPSRLRRSNAILFFCLFVSFSLSAQESTLKGRVLRESNRLPIENAAIQLKGTSTATKTDEQGEFALEGNFKYPITLKISHIGYQTQELLLHSSSVSLIISLVELSNQLSEVTVSSGYFTQKKSEFSGAVSNVSAKQLQNRPTVSFDQLLGGQASGIDIIQPSGVLNSAPVMRVRGINTITSGLFPLVVVDGVALFVGSIGGLIGNNPLSDINPNDIESIDVLKDASAAAG